MQNDSFKMRQHYAPYNRSEESHRVTDSIYISLFGRGIFRLRSIWRTFLRVILSMSSEQTCLQGFANEDIHKALAFFIKNAENGSFNALALSAE